MARQDDKRRIDWRGAAHAFALGAMLATLIVGALVEHARRIGAIAIAGDIAQAQDAAAAHDRAAFEPGLVSLLKRVYAEFAEDRIPAVAGGITFFALLALFPGIGAVFSLYGLIGDPAAIGSGLDHLRGFLPGGAIAVLDADLKRLMTQAPQALGIGFAISVVIALWSTSGGIQALIDGLNVAYETGETRGFLRITLLALCLAASVVILIVGAIALLAVLPAAIDRLHPSPPFDFVIDLLLPPLAYALCALSVALTYRFGPARKTRSVKGILWASLIVAALWIGGTFVFSWYVQTFGSYDRTYGSLGAVVGFLTWLWLSLTVLLGGAELAYELDRRRDAITTAALSPA